MNERRTFMRGGKRRKSVRLEEVQPQHPILPLQPQQYVPSALQTRLSLYFVPKECIDAHDHGTARRTPKLPMFCFCSVCCVKSRWSLRKYSLLFLEMALSETLNPVIDRALSGPDNFRDCAPGVYDINGAYEQGGYPWSLWDLAACK